MRARNCVWRQPTDAVSGPSVQLTRKLARHSVNPVAQEQVRRAHRHNRNIPSRDARPTPGALRPNPALTEMQNLWPTLPGPNARACVGLSVMEQVR